MTMRNVKLIQAFKSGVTEGKNHTGSMSIYAYENGDTLLVGYDNAIYAHRNGGTNEVTKFIEWVYGSNTNKQHIESFDADHVVQAQPQLTANGDIRRDGAEVLKRLTQK